MTKKYLIAVTRLLCAIDSATISLIPLEDQVIQINVSIPYANTTGFIVIVRGKKNMQTSHFQRKWTIRRGFCYGNELLWLHLSTTKDSFYSVHKPVKWTSLFVRGSRLHNMLSSPRYVISAFGFVVRLHVQNMN